MALNSVKSWFLIADSHGCKASKRASETEECIEVLYASRKTECVTDCTMPRPLMNSSCEFYGAEVLLTKVHGLDIYHFRSLFVLSHNSR
jgi:hypothetical protein